MSRLSNAQLKRIGAVAWIVGLIIGIANTPPGAPNIFLLALVLTGLYWAVLGAAALVGIGLRLLMFTTAAVIVTVQDDAEAIRQSRSEPAP